MKIQETEIWRKMLSGELYDATDPMLVKELNRVKGLLARYNATDPEDALSLDAQIRSLLGSAGAAVKVIQPFYCDYGANIAVGDNFFANFGFTVLDEARVTIGDNVFIGPNVSIYTACHPLDPQVRNRGVEWSRPVTIGDNCWIGGSATLLPGVTVGRNATIGAGSVVTRDVPDGEVWAGNPAHKIKELPALE